MRNRTKLLAGGAVAAVLGIGIWVVHEGRHSVSVSDTATAEQAAVAQHSLPTTATSQPHQTAQSPSISIARRTSKAGEFDDLVKSGKPANHFQAYLLAQACVWAPEAQRSAEVSAPAQRDDATRSQLEKGDFQAKTDEACGDLTDQQLSGRRKYLEDAAEAGVPMAATFGGRTLR